MLDYENVYRIANPLEFKQDNDLINFQESLGKLKERLEIAKTETLFDQIEKYDDIRETFSTPVCNLNPLYQNLVSTSDFEAYKNETLKPLITYIINDINWKCYFSMSGDKMTGFVGYMIDPITKTSVSVIKMFSVDLKHTLILLMDLDSLLDDLRGKYDYIHWDAFKRNKIGNKIYLKAIKKYKGVCQEVGDGENAQCLYTIPGLKEIPDAIKSLAKFDFTQTTARKLPPFRAVVELPLRILI